MQTHTRKKLEIIVEAAALKRAEQILIESGVHVFTVLDGREGRGLSGRWEDPALEQRLIVAVAAADVAEKVAARLVELFERYPGVLFASDVEVLRAERF